MPFIDVELFTVCAVVTRSWSRSSRILVGRLAVSLDGGEMALLGSGGAAQVLSLDCRAVCRAELRRFG